MGASVTDKEKDDELLNKWKIEQNIPPTTRKIKKIVQPLFSSNSMKKELINSLESLFIQWVKNHYPSSKNTPECFRKIVNNCPNDIIFELHSSFLIWRQLKTPDAKQDVLEFIFRSLAKGISGC